jgi:hypothetical protein
MSRDTPAPDLTRDPIVSLPGRQWGYLVLMVIGTVVLGTAIAFQVQMARARRPAAKFETLLVVLMGGSGVGIVLAQVHAIWLERKHPLTIRHSGVELGAIALSWPEIDECHWGRSTPGELNIQANRKRFIVSIPARHCAEVEAVLRHFGKWTG